MNLSIHPDPAARGGGYAFLALPEGMMPAGPVTVSVMETFGQRWLAPGEAEGDRIGIGNPHWQTERHAFGPYEIHKHQGCDWVRIGPEIVNKLEEYTPLRIEVGGVSEDIAWPDDVPPQAGAAVRGGLQTVVAKPPARPEPTLVAERYAPEPVVEPEPEPAPEEPAAAPVETPEDPQRSPFLRFILPGLLTLAVLAAILWVMLALPDDTPVAETVDPEVISGLPCTAEALAGVPGGFGAIMAKLGDCAGSLSPDAVLGLLETAAAADDPAALMLFGTIYDGARTDPVIEEQIGLTFASDPAQAAEYYHRAVATGAVEAAGRLEVVCSELTQLDTTLARGAHDDYCS